MRALTTTRTLLLVLLMATIAAAKDKTPPTYEHGTITGWSMKYYPGFLSGKHKFYELKGTATVYQINDCGDFQTGQSVDYRVEERLEEGNTIHKIYIRGENGKEHKCNMEGARSTAPASAAPSTAPRR
jgi:hypothetical protein